MDKSAADSYVYAKGERKPSFLFHRSNESKAHIRRGKEPQRINERNQDTKASTNSYDTTGNTGNANSRPQTVMRDGT